MAYDAELSLLPVLPEWQQPRLMFDLPFTEAQLAARIMRRCNGLDLLWFHAYGSNVALPGFPDLVIVGEDEVAFWELKSITGTLSLAQEKWRRGLREAHRASYSVVTPKDWESGELDRRLRLLGGLEDSEAA